jgi:hypothetical protein
MIVLLKKYGVAKTIMHTKKTNLFIFAVVLSVVLVTAGSHNLSALAKSGSHKARHSGSTNTDENGSTGNDKSGFSNQLNQLSDCLTNAASNGQLSRLQYDDCYNQIFLQQDQQQGQLSDQMFSQQQPLQNQQQPQQHLSPIPTQQYQHQPLQNQQQLQQPSSLAPAPQSMAEGYPWR